MSEVTFSAQTAYPTSAPSARVRLAALAPHIAAHGVELRYEPTLTEKEYATITSDASPVVKGARLAGAAARLLRSRGRGDADGLLIHRLRFLGPLPGIEPARRLDVYDFDDALYLSSILERNRGFGWLKREAEHWRSYVRRARLVIAGNVNLAERASEYARRVEVVPSCVDPEAQQLREHGDRDFVTIGWIGSRSTADQLRDVLPAIAALNQERMRAKLVVVGAGDLGSTAAWLEQRPWSLEDEHRQLASFDIGIMPLPNTEWTRGKCGYKLLQYFSAGVPAVASPVGVNTAIVGPDGARGLLATTLEEWRAALERLIGDTDARAAMGAEARRYVEREFSYRRWAPELAALLADL